MKQVAKDNHRHTTVNKRSIYFAWREKKSTEMKIGDSDSNEEKEE